MKMHSPRRRASTAADSARAASPLPRSTGICCAPTSTHFNGALRNSSFLARKRGGRRAACRRKSATISGSTSLTWLATTMMPPSRGMFSSPRQWRVVNMRSSGFTTTTTRRYQNPRRMRCGTIARMPDVRSVAQSWAVVVPVKRLGLAKTRLSVDRALRRELALAMSTDTVLACRRTTGVVEVVVVTDDEVAGPAMRALGATVVPDEPDTGLNPALSYGVQAARSRHRVSGLVLLSSDLPALTPEALAPLLQRSASLDAGCVADAAGTGTTALTLGPGSSYMPSFGAGSRQRHVDAGAFDLTTYADPRLRRDVDTRADLAEAMALGCGAATVTVVSAHPALLE